MGFVGDPVIRNWARFGDQKLVRRLEFGVSVKSEEILRSDDKRFFR